MNVSGGSEISAEGFVGLPPTEEDLEGLVGLFSDSRVVATLGGARTPLQVREILARWQALWRDRGLGPWVLRHPSSGVFLGYAGVAMASAGRPGEVELLYALLPQFWREGIATRASTSAIDFVFADETQKGSITELIAYALVDNKASRGVIEKLGFAYERQIEHAGWPHAFYRLTRESWSAERRGI